MVPFSTRSDPHVRASPPEDPRNLAGPGDTRIRITIWNRAWREWRKVAQGAALLLATGGLISGLAPTSDGGERAAAPVATETVTETLTPAAAPALAAELASPPAASRYGPGTYVVGEDIEPGRYRAGNPDGNTCYWARLSDLSSGSVIDNNLSSGPMVLEIQPGDTAVEFAGACTFAAG